MRRPYGPEPLKSLAGFLNPANDRSAARHLTLRNADQAQAAVVTLMSGEVGGIVGEYLCAQTVDRKVVSPHRLTPGRKRLSSLRDATRQGERCGKEGRAIDEAGRKIGRFHEVRDRELVAPMPELVLAEEMMPDADAPVARTESKGMLDRRSHLLEMPHQEMNMARVGERFDIAWIERQGPTESGQRRIEATLTLPHIAAAEPGPRPARRPRDRTTAVPRRDPGEPTARDGDSSSRARCCAERRPRATRRRMAPGQPHDP